MQMITAALALLLALQDAPEQRTIPRSARDPYAANVPACERAAGMLESDPQGALEILDRILDDVKIESANRECRLRWEVSPGTYGKYYDFFPYQFRGLARMKLGVKAKATDPDRARTLLQGAAADFQISVNRGLRASSQGYLAEVRKELASLTDPGAALRIFQTDWRKIVDAGRFVEAKKLLESERGRELADAERKSLADDTDVKCRIAVAAAVQRFLDNLRLVTAPRQLEMVPPATFARDFSLPDRALLVDAGVLPEYLWCLDVVPALKLVLDKKDALEPLLLQAVRAAALAAKADFEGFWSLERLGYEVVRGRVSDRADQSLNAPAERRRTLRAEAEALRDRWKRFDAEVRKAGAASQAFLDRLPARDFTAILDRIPVDVAVGDEALASILKSAAAADPDAALVEVQKRLEKIRSGSENLSVESRRDLLRYLIVAAALRALLAGELPDQVVADLKPLGTEFKSLGGAADEARFGPKVQKVFQLLVK